MKFKYLIAAMILVLAGCGNTPTNPDNGSSGQNPSPYESGSAQLKQDDAEALIREKFPQEEYQINLVEEAVKTNQGEEFFVFEVKTSKEALQPYIAVEKQSGTLLCYKADGSFSPYADFPTYDPSVDAVCDWNGTFLSDNKTEMELAQADSNSFEVMVDGNFIGVARIKGNTANYKDDSVAMDFVYENDNTIVVTGNFAGTYTLQK